MPDNNSNLQANLPRFNPNAGPVTQEQLQAALTDIQYQISQIPSGGGSSSGLTYISPDIAVSTVLTTAYNDATYIVNNPLLEIILTLPVAATDGFKLTVMSIESGNKCSVLNTLGNIIGVGTGGNSYDVQGDSGFTQSAEFQRRGNDWFVILKALTPS